MAYIEFHTKEAALRAKHLNETLFKGRQLTVMPKRKNKPGMGRGAPFMGRGHPMAMMMAMVQGMMKRGGGYRGRGRGRGGAGGPPGGRGRGMSDAAD